jgi:hypothetical protein
MEDLNDKITGGTLTAPEWNQVPSEIQNVIEGLGITLSSGDVNQLGKAIAGYVANGAFYTDSGAADAYVLSVVGSKQAPTAYTDGMRVRCIIGNTNTGASTANVASLGVKNIKTPSGADPAAGALKSGSLATLRYAIGTGTLVIEDGFFPPSVQVFTASGTWTRPSDVTAIVVEVVGGGGGGGGYGTTAGGAGAAGGYAKKLIVNPTASETVTIGAGGAGGASGDNDGTAGGTSSFGSLASATGGPGGQGSAGIAGGQPGGLGSGGDINIYGGDGCDGDVGGVGGASVFGSGGRHGGTSGVDANAPGSGGGGCHTSTGPGGDGADGIIIVWEHRL